MTQKTSTAAVIDVPAIRDHQQLAVQERSPLPALTTEQTVAALRAYRELQQTLDKEMPDQIIQLDGKPFRKKGYWRAIALSFDLEVEPVEEIREVFGTLPDGTENYCYSVTYRAKTLRGRPAFGDGSCTASEKSKGRLRPSEHNVRSHAHTRAYNRAVSNLVAFGEVSAEEAERDDAAGPEPSQQRGGRQQPARPAAAPLAKPEGYDAWHDTLIAAADQGEVALQKVWGETPGERGFRRYISTQDSMEWDRLKMRALQADKARQGGAR